MLYIFSNYFFLILSLQIFKKIYYLDLDTGFLCEALAVPQWALETRLTLDSEICLRLCPQGWDGRRATPGFLPGEHVQV